MNPRLLFYMAVSIALTAGAGWYISRMLDAGINSYLYVSLDAGSSVPGAAVDAKPAPLPAGRMPRTGDAAIAEASPRTQRESTGR